MIHVWNVGHGEAIRIDLTEKVSIVRDFGQTSAPKDKTSNRLSIQQVYDSGLCSTGKEMNAALSHAHSDHFNGFRWLYEKRRLRGVFRECYIPWLDFHDQKSLGWKATILNCYFLAYSGPTTSIGQDAKYWLLAAPIMRGLSETLYGVLAGTRIGFEGTCHVLWPPPPSDHEIYYAVQNDLLEKGVRTIEASLGALGGGDAVHGVRDWAERVFEILRAYYPKEPSNKQSESTVPSPQQVRRDIKVIETSSEELGKMEMPRTEPRVRRAFARAAHGTHNFIDEHSLVFELPGKCLFLSDLSPAAMDSMADLYMPTPRSYNLLKSAHHGTRFRTGTFSRKIIATDKILHCCGPGHSSCGPPIADYEQYISGGRREVTCTDWDFERWPNCPRGYILFRSSHEQF